MRRSDRLNLAGLDGAQELGLQLQRQLDDLIEKQRAAVGRAEVAERILARVGKGAASHDQRVLGLRERFDQICAIESDEWSVGNRAERV